MVSQSQQFQYEAQAAADMLARNFLFGTRLVDALLPGFMTAAAAGMGETDLFLDMGGADFPAVLGQYVGRTFTIPPPPPPPPPAVLRSANGANCLQNHVAWRKTHGRFGSR